MSIVLTNDSNYTAIASSIRSKLGVSTTYLPSEMSDAIDSISSGYSITVTTSHCTAASTNPTSIGEGNIAELIITPDAGYELAPPTITGASIRKRGSDRIEIENPTGNVTINIEAAQPDYFWVENIGTSTAYFSAKDGFMYSTDGLNWITSATGLSAGNKMYIKGNIGKVTGGSQTPLLSSSSYKFAIGGNLFTLLDYSGILEDYDDACYFMFYGNKAIVDASQLYINNVGENTCNYMFSGCTSLTQAPQLLATTLARNCYNEMFSGCTSLTAAPQLPATTSAYQCYYLMFKGCTALTQVPELPATTLAESCYCNMFEGCTSLITAPSLPATTLAKYCYSAMFRGCTSLTQASELPATTLAEDCYLDMFAGCTSLATAPQLSATTLATNCCRQMFRDCTSLTTVQLPATTLASSCYQNMFNNCTSLTTAPELPATTLAYMCYQNMFDGCTSLTTAPSLPATTLASSCYSLMFKNCTSLTTAPELPAVIGVAEVSVCYSGMFDGCSSLKVYRTSGEGHDVEWRIPSEGVIYYDSTSQINSNMFYGTTGDYHAANVQFKAGEAVVVYTQNQPV